VRVDTGYLVGCDLGQAADYTALAIVQRFEDRAYFGEDGKELEGADLNWVLTCRDPRHMPAVRLESSTTYDVVHLERLPLGTPYPKVVTTLRQLLGNQALAGSPRLERRPPELVVDATGVGRPVVDALRADGLRPVPVTITGGDLVTPGRPGWRVPKRDLIGGLSVLLQNQRLRIAAALAFARTLTDELLRFRVKLDPVTAHDSYGAWREGDHDDLVLALAIAVWWGQRRGAPELPGGFAVVPPSYA
jgi:hypothetical protein